MGCNCSKCRSESSSSNNKGRCNGCICDLLRELRKGTEVDVFLSGGKILEDVVFKRFDHNSCCAFFIDTTIERGSTLIVDCQKIDALRIEVD
ncbi:hydrolase [Solibacillus sp. A46]|uniref:Hydrolase n=1 Tax=Solibacillus faecavium TaxID=2762221 RepID=A0ABR8XW52_9BACL|nr:hydrolase [Solibacillus faecavium]MBD8036169.1 hydrolase [Solibacillus faecavium]